MEWHSLSVKEVLAKLEISPEGLSSEEAKRRLARHGSNILEFIIRRSWPSIFFSQFKNPFIIILVAAGAISALLGDFTDTLVIVAAVILNTVLGFFQEQKAEKTFFSLKHALQEYAYVARNGQEIRIKREEVVPGDIVILYRGEKVPADLRLIEEKNLFLDESILTGEWLPVKKESGETALGAPVFNRSNMVFAGTLVTEGGGRGVAVATAGHTELGRVAGLTVGAEETPNPLEKELKTISRYIGAATISAVVAIFFLGVLWRGLPLLDMFLSSAALAVAAVPEGLLISVTIIMAVGMQRIFKERTLVRHLFAAQTLGSTSVIATDKTGTLTEGKMQVAGLLTATGEIEHDGKKYGLPIMTEKEKENTHAVLLRIAMLASEAEIENPDAGLEELRIFGNPTETALVLAAHQAGFRKKELLKSFPRLDFLPFDSKRRFSLFLHKDESGQRNIFYALGEPEMVLSFSQRAQLDGETGELNASRRKEIVGRVEKAAGRGLRVIAAGYRFVKKENLNNYSDELKDFVFVGLITLRDPLRPDAAEAVKVSREAGIFPVLITGDHRLTAETIAREAGILAKDGEGRVLTGEGLQKLGDEELEKRIGKTDIFARVTPEQKLRIIEAWQKKGAVVAMTGDGVNDAPALRRADIGIALGGGTDLAKEASDIVLLDNSFSGILAAIQEGRIIFDNIRKILVFLLSDAFSETILVASGVLFGFPLPLLPAQILWINLVEDSLPNAVLVFESGDGGLMKEKPSAFRKILNAPSVIMTAVSGIVTVSLALSLFLYFLSHGGDLIHIRTMIFVMFGVDSLFRVFSIRNFYKPVWSISLLANKFLLPVSAIGVFFMLAAVYVPFLQSIVHTAPLTIFEWLIIIVYGFITLAVMELLKKILFFKKSKFHL